MELRKLIPGVQTLGFPYCKASNEVLINMNNNSDNFVSGVQALGISECRLMCNGGYGRDKKN